jgi:hypothetical protein
VGWAAAAVTAAGCSAAARVVLSVLPCGQSAAGVGAAAASVACTHSAAAELHCQQLDSGCSALD